jgi:hypothetical protein
MHDEDRTNTQAEKWEGLEREAIYLLTDPDSYPTLWSLPDLGRELDHFDPEAVIRPLRLAGLVYRTSDGYVFATPAAFKMAHLADHAS